jgi:hypothetical protein
LSAVAFAAGCVGCAAAVATGLRIASHGNLRQQVAASACLIAAASLIYTSVAVPWATAKDNVRPIGKALDTLLPEGAGLCVLNPGIEPFLFYIQRPYSVVDRPSRIPAGTTHLLAERSVYDKARGTRQFDAFGFTELTGNGTNATVFDKDGDEWVLLAASRGGAAGAAAGP